MSDSLGALRRRWPEAAEVIEGTRRWCVLTADALDVFMGMPPGCVDALITDPPYSSGGTFRGDRNQKTSTKYVNSDSLDTCRVEFTGDNRDQRSFMAWSSVWFGQALRAARQGAITCVFTDWRQLPTMTDALQGGGWVWRNIVTWWKPGNRMQRGRFSGSAEYILYASKGVPSEGQESPQNVLAIASVDGEDKVHIAEKPIELLRALVGVAVPGAVVLDPFCGSGTTGVACLETGRSFIGIELDGHHAEVARQRLAEAEADQRNILFPAIEPPTQRSLEDYLVEDAADLPQ